MDNGYNDNDEMNDYEIDCFREQMKIYNTEFGAHFRSCYFT